MSRSARVRWAVALWLVFAFVVWNVIFDRVLVVAGRVYAHDASAAMQRGERLLRIDDYMRPAVADAVRLATVGGLAVAIVGVIAVSFAARRERAGVKASPDAL